MAGHDAAPDPHEFTNAGEACEAIFGAGVTTGLLGSAKPGPAAREALIRGLRARVWLTRLGEYGLERIGMMTRREVLERFAEATVIADAEPENDAWGGVAMGYAAVLTGELPVEGMPGALAHELTLAMNADRDAQEARPCART